MTDATPLAGAADLLKALATDIRVAVVVELRDGPRCVHELQSALRRRDREVSQPLMSHHLRVLRDAGLVVSSRRGTEIAYELADAHVGHLVGDALHLAKERDQ
jgi:ArsR family transcriptional regulator